MRGMTDWTPADLSFCTTSGAAADVAAWSDGFEGSVSMPGLVKPARCRSGSRYWFRATWSLVRSPATMPTGAECDNSPEEVPHATTVARIWVWSGPVHHR